MIAEIFNDSIKVLNVPNGKVKMKFNCKCQNNYSAKPALGFLQKKIDFISV